MKNEIDLNRTNMNESENNETVKSALDAALAYLEASHKALNLPTWATITLASGVGGYRSHSIFGNPPGPYRFISAHGSTLEEAHTEWRKELGGDKLRAQIEKLQAQLAQVEGGAV